MTKDDVIRMARKSGIELYGLGRDRENFLCILESFTKLVAAAERDKFCAVLRQLHDSYSLASTDAPRREHDKG